MGTALPFPKFYNPAHAASWDYGPDLQEVLEGAQDYRRRFSVKPSSSAAVRIHLLNIDNQKDFDLPPNARMFSGKPRGGTLYVAGRSGTGAIDDSRRLAEFIYREAGNITDITDTMDTHFAYQCFFPSFWLLEDGNHPTSHSLVDLSASEQLVNLDLGGKEIGRVKPNPAMMQWLLPEVNPAQAYTWVVKQMEFYCRELKLPKGQYSKGQYTLYLWPFHCILGTDGHALLGAIAEARMFQAFLRGVQSNKEIKAGNPWTENYGVISPEVLKRWDGKGQLGQQNVAFLKRLLADDIIVIAGQAASHCVKSSIEQILDGILAQDPALAKKCYLLEDCMSAVTVPDGKGGFAADFTPQAEAAILEFKKAGMHVVKSTDSIESWPGVGALTA